MIKKIVALLAGLVAAIAIAFGQPPQHVNQNYQFKAVGGDSSLRAPKVLSANAYYIDTGSIYYNKTDHKLHWLYTASSFSGLRDTTFNTGPTPYPFTTQANAYDTLIRQYAGIPQPTGSGVLGTQITWTYLTGGGHDYTRKLDSVIVVDAGRGGLKMGFPTCQEVFYANLNNDEQTYPLISRTIVDLDGAVFPDYITKAGQGLIISGDGLGNWQVVSETLGGYTWTADPAAGGILSFDMVDPMGLYLGPTTNGAVVTYVGNNGYNLQRLFTGLSRNFKYQLMLGTVPVTSNPTTTDYITINFSSIWYDLVDFRQYTAETNEIFFEGLPNFWHHAVVREYPDSLQVFRPHAFTCTSPSSGTMNVSWTPTPNQNGQILDSLYELRQSTSGNFWNETVVYRGTGLSTTITGLTSGTTYYYRVNAIRTVIGPTDVHSGHVYNHQTSL